MPLQSLDNVFGVYLNVFSCLIVHYLFHIITDFSLPNETPPSKILGLEFHPANVTPLHNRELYSDVNINDGVYFSPFRCP